MGAAWFIEMNRVWRDSARNSRHGRLAPLFSVAQRLSKPICDGEPRVSNEGVGARHRWRQEYERACTI